MDGTDIASKIVEHVMKQTPLFVTFYSIASGEQRVRGGY